MKVLVTGGAGYIGSHAVKELVKDHEVIVYDSLELGNKEFIDEKALFIQGGLSDTEKLDSLFKENNIDIVMHFANYALVGESVENPSKYFENNLVNGLNLLDSMVKNNINKIIFSSSCAVYGSPKEIPIVEKHTLNPINSYGESKMVFERVLRYYDTAYNLKSISLRYFNVGGASLDNSIGEKHQNETHLIPIILDVALDKRENIKIFGDDYDTKDGTCIRDFVHVVDIAKAHLDALNYLEKNMKTKSYNVGTGQGYSVKEVIDLCKQITKKEINVVVDKRREGDPSMLVADPKRFKEEVGWKEQFNINEMIEHAWNWHQKIN
jgi:UDP-glucose 4-epimerase